MKKTHTLILIPLLMMLWFSGYADDSNNERDAAYYTRASPVHAQLVEIEKAILIYSMSNNGKFPDSLDKLMQPMGERKSISPLFTKKDSLLDPWGEPIGYELDDRKFVLFSSGPDKKVGTKDDIVRGRPESYVESWKARQTQLLESQGTNAVKEATAEAVPLPPVAGKTIPERVPATDGQPSDEPAEKKDSPWDLLLLIGAVILCSVVATWRCLRRK